MTIRDSNNPYASVYNLKPLQPSFAQKANEAKIEDDIFQMNESYKNGMREFKLVDSKTTAAKNADEGLAIAQSEVRRTTDIMRARLLSNTNIKE